MADFSKLQEKLNSEASGSSEAGSAKEKCPKKRKPCIFVAVARTDNANAINNISVELSGATKATKITDGDGMAKFDPVKPGAHAVKLALNDSQQKEFIAIPTEEVSAATGKPSTLLLKLGGKPNLEVTVVLNKNATKTPVDDINVVITGPKPATGTQEKKSTKPAGIAKFEKLTAGNYTIEAKLTDKQSADFAAPAAIKHNVTVGADHKITIELVPAEANSIRISKLSRWFVPGHENCDLGYVLDGRHSTADRLMLEVHASNYCELDSWNNGLPKFKPLTDTPVYTRGLGSSFVQEKAAKSIDDWKGEANCAKGILALTDKGNRVINVACSPYTVHFRYYKDDPADAKARIDLQPFWPAFDNAGAPKPDTLKIKFAIKESTKLKLGKLSIWNKEDKEIFSKDLAEGDVGKGDHTIDWDGKDKDGNKITAAGMPFRVQIQANTKKGELKGLALAAMHTEVRLYVHPDTIAVDKDPYVAKDDKSSLYLDFANPYQTDKEPTKAADGKLWTKYMLTKAGFHPGPVNDVNANAHFNTALAEFQRSVPKNLAPPFTRLTISTTGGDDDDTKAALTNLTNNRKRPWFGKTADKSDYTDADERGKDFRDPTKSMIVWVDDRHWYTDPNWLDSSDDVTPKIRPMVTGSAQAVGNTRGAYTIGDARVTLDETDVARPWIAVNVDLWILNKTQQLTDKLTDKPADDVLKAMRKAIGPIRVDWSFDEIDGDTIAVPEVDRTHYHKQRTRTRAALEWALDNLKTANYARKDVKRQATYFNCPAANDGIRPANSVGYYKAPFGLDAEALLPYKTADDTTRETIATVVHDALGQPAANLFAQHRLGRAGVYFHPSRMAGDGYRLRAQAWFAKLGDYNLVNVENLAKRYLRPPQAHTAALRLWRKSSIRGYLQWGPNNNWPGTRGGMLEQHHACHLHLVNELAVTDAAVAVALTQFWNSATPSDLATFRSMVKSCVKAASDPRRVDANILLTGNRMWPWHAHGNLGILNPVGPNPANPWNDVFTGFVSQVNGFWFKLTNRYAIELTKTIESKLGRMRGHIIVEFLTAPDFWSRQYQCNTCNDIYYYCAKDGTTVTHHNAPCPSPGCAGRLQDTGAANASQYPQQIPVPSLGDPLGVSYNFDGTAPLWAHELSHNRYYEHAANAPGSDDAQHDHVNNPDPTVSADAFVRPAPDGTNAARQWDRACLMTYVSHLASYDATKDKPFFCFKCVLKNRGWKLAGVNNPPGATTEP